MVVKRKKVASKAKTAKKVTKKRVVAKKKTTKKAAPNGKLLL